MNLRLESTCQGDGKIYLQMVVDRLIDDAVVGVAAHAKDGAEIPSLLLPFHPTDSRSQANFIVVMPHLSLREVDLDFEEYGASEAPVSRGHLTVELNNMGWRSRLNSFVRNDLVNQMLDIEHEYSAGRMNVYLTSAVDDGEEIVVRMLVDMPNVPDADVMVDFLDDAGHGFDLPVYPLVDEVVPGSRVGEDERLRIEFSVRVNRSSKDFCVKVYDAAEFVEGSFARFCDETYVSLRNQTEGLLADAANDPDYSLWYYRHRATLSEVEVQRQTSLSFEPVVSLVMPLAPEDRSGAFASLDALLRQSYDLFEVVLVDGCPQECSFDGLLSNWAGDPRIVRVSVDPATDDATRMATGLMQARGAYRAVLEPSVVLAPEALFEFVRQLNEPASVRDDFWVSGWSGSRSGAGVPQVAERPDCLGDDAVALFCNHDHEDPRGLLHDPEFKPVCSPGLLRSRAYVGPFVLFSADVIQAVAQTQGFTSEGFLHDLYLKAWELGVPFCRIDKVLYHVQNVNRANRELATLSDERAARDTRGGRKAVAQHLRRLGLAATVVAEPFGMDISYHLPHPVPSVSVVLFSGNDPEVLAGGIRRLIEAKEMVPFQLVVVDHARDRRSFARLYEEVRKLVPGLTIAPFEGKPSRAAFANAGAKAATGDYLLFLDPAMELIGADPIASMMLACQVPGTGVVGAKLLYSDDTLAQAGVYVGVRGSAGAMGAGLPRTRQGYLGRFMCASELSAASLSCLMVSRDAFDAVSGFDQRFRMGLVDVDFCLRVAKEGWRVVLEPSVEAYDHRSVNPERLVTEDARLRYEQERAYFRYRWPKHFVKGDPFLSSGLDWQSAYFGLSD
ncbi:MAG: hypothetical protein Q4F23_01745 [Coriobacteriia bacterium]|nr:hypothetical protein [Coriobacteriia bacterium]